MKKILGIIMIGISLLFFSILFIAGFLGYFVTHSRNGVIIDGLGRLLSESPLFLRVVFGQDRLWAGFWWFITDMSIFWGGLGLIYLIATNGVKLSKNSRLIMKN